METVLDYLLSKLEEERSALVENLSEGQVKDYAEYQYRCGVVRGLLIAASFANDLKSDMEQNDD